MTKQNKSKSSKVSQAKRDALMARVVEAFQAESKSTARVALAVFNAEFAGVSRDELIAASGAAKSTVSKRAALGKALNRIGVTDYRKADTATVNALQGILTGNYGPDVRAKVAGAKSTRSAIESAVSGVLNGDTELKSGKGNAGKGKGKGGGKGKAESTLDLDGMSTANLSSLAEIVLGKLGKRGNVTRESVETLQALTLALGESSEADAA